MCRCITGNTMQKKQNSKVKNKSSYLVTTSENKYLHSCDLTELTTLYIYFIATSLLFIYSHDAKPLHTNICSHLSQQTNDKITFRAGISNTTTNHPSTRLYHFVYCCVWHCSIYYILKYIRVDYNTLYNCVIFLTEDGSISVPTIVIYLG